jgi:hypothetical protein
MADYRVDADPDAVRTGQADHQQSNDQGDAPPARLHNDQGQDNQDASRSGNRSHPGLGKNKPDRDDGEQPDVADDQGKKLPDNACFQLPRRAIPCPCGWAYQRDTVLARQNGKIMASSPAKWFRLTNVSLATSMS